MKKNQLYFVMFSSLLLFGCTSNPPKISTRSVEEPIEIVKEASTVKKRKTVYDFPLSEAKEEEVFTNGKKTAFIDVSRKEDGYISCKDLAHVEKVMVQITYPDGTMYQYPIITGEYRALPLTGGSGTYGIKMLEHVKNKQYSVALFKEFDVTIRSEFEPYIRPNQYADYTPSSEAVILAQQFSEESKDDLDFVAKVFNYVTENITYDIQLARNIPPNYIPDIDTTLTSKKGICFDYAALTTSMLRCQKIPTKLQVGYAGEVYHAWISVYLEQYGWINNIIEFKENEWTLMDPTLSASNDLKAVQKYIGDGTNYSLKYNY